MSEKDMKISDKNMYLHWIFLTIIQFVIKELADKLGATRLCCSCVVGKSSFAIMMNDIA